VTTEASPTGSDVFGSQRVRSATLLTVGAVFCAALVAGESFERSRADAAVRRDRAAVEAAAQRLAFPSVANAWLRMKLFDHQPLEQIETSVGLRARTIHEEAGAVVFTFPSGYGTRQLCFDLAVRPDRNTVHSRHC
jgi:hypothetical protein